MSVAFNIALQSFLINARMVLVLLILLIAPSSFGHEQNQENESELFHESETPMVTRHQWNLQTADEKLQIVVLERDYGEPATEPLRIVVGYQLPGQDFHRLTPEGDKFMAKSFCGVEEPILVDRDQFLQEHGIATDSIPQGQTFFEPGQYLVIYVRQYDENQGTCQTQATSVEAYWLEGLLNPESAE